MGSDSRIVEVPLAYPVEGRRRGGRREEAIMVRDTCQVTLRVLSAADAPVVARATPDGEAGRVEWRLLDGVVMEPVFHGAPLDEMAMWPHGNRAGRPRHDNPLIAPGSPLAALAPPAATVGMGPWSRPRPMRTGSP